MPNTRKPRDETTDAAPTKSRRAASPKAADAFALLKADHAEVKQCFKEYEKLAQAQADDAERQALAERICAMLTVHATIEEEIFYPAARDVLDDSSLVDEADVEHASAKELIAQIESLGAGDDHFDAHVKVLGEYIDHHVKEEQDELFPKLKKAGLDAAAIGEALRERKQELMAETDAVSA